MEKSSGKTHVCAPPCFVPRRDHPELAPCSTPAVMLVVVVMLEPSRAVPSWRAHGSCRRGQERMTRGIFLGRRAPGSLPSLPPAVLLEDSWETLRSCIPRAASSSFKTSALRNSPSWQHRMGARQGEKSPERDLIPPSSHPEPRGPQLPPKLGKS